MSKKAWITVAIFYLVSVLSLGTVALIFIIMKETFFWISFFWLNLAFLIIILFVSLLSNISIKNFYKILKHNEFLIEKEYDYDKTIICIDFTNKKLACNALSLNPIVFFHDIKSSEIEVSDLSFNRSSVVLIIGIKLKGSAFNFSYIKMFKKTVKGQFLSFDNIVMNTIKKSKEIINIKSLNDDIKKIMMINKDDGYSYDEETLDFKEIYDFHNAHKKNIFY